MDRSTRRQLGRYYTPAPLAAEVVRWTLGPLLGHSELNILDPACGEGVFLSDAQRFLAGRSGVHLVGVDRDASALQRAQKVLPAADLRCGDALSGWPSLHGLFLELAVRLSRGRVGLLLPAQVCDLESYAPVRTLVRRHGRVEEPCAYFGEEAFEGVSQPCCAVILDHDTNGTPGGGAPFAFSGVESTPSGHRRPPPGTFGDIGVHTGNCAGKLLRPGGAPIREGKDVQPYSLASPSKTLLADRPKLAGEY
ncbi:MAG: methyltransferase domain-containing protein, partial [Planctomycetota bacterium]